ncbi:MAG: recombinase family protein [Lachnospiraceae bacterium]|nr:recombinase family protein [Lachnospiraceae bacterium]
MLHDISRAEENSRQGAAYAHAGQDRVAFYIRLSQSDAEVRSGERDESNSITGQRSLLAAYIREHEEFAGWETIEYFDDGVSGSLFAGRDSFQTMLADARDGRFRCLIVKDFSRLGRDYIEVGNFMEYVFPAMGLRFISVNDRYDSFAPGGTAGRVDAAFKNLIHQMYAMDGSRKVKAAKRARNERGEYTSGLVPYGYRKDPEDMHRFVIDGYEAGIVREIFALAADGCSYNKIARLLNDRNEPTPYDRKLASGGNRKTGHKGYSDYRVWGTAAVRNIIRNPAYKGQMVQNRYETVGYGDSKKCVRTDEEDWTVAEDAVPAIVEADLFDSVNRMKRHPGRRQPEKTEKNLFVCPHCGRKLTKTSPNGRYICTVRKVKSRTDCGQVYMRVEQAKSMVLETVKGIALVAVSNRDYYDRREKDRIRKIDALMKRLEKEKDRLEKCVLSSYEEYSAGHLTKEEYIVSRKACRASIDGVEEKMDALWRELHRTVKVDDGALVECRSLREYDPDLLARVVEKVLVYDDKRLEVVFDADDMFTRELPEDAI